MTLTAAQEKEVAAANEKRDADAAKLAEAERKLALKRQAQAEQQALYDAQPRVRVGKLLADLRKPHIGEDRMTVLWHTVVQLVEAMVPLLPEIKPLKPVADEKPPAPNQGFTAAQQEAYNDGQIRQRPVEQQGDYRPAQGAVQQEPEGYR